MKEKVVKGPDWECITAAAEWEPRDSCAELVCRDCLWIMGGTSDFYHSNDKTLFNDIWSSEDGRTWRLESESAPWAPRAYPELTTLRTAG